MNRKLLLSTALAALGCAATQAAVVVTFDGTGDLNTVTSSVNFGTSANTTLATTTIENDTQRSIVNYGTTLATNGVGTYTGPTIKGGLYENAIYSTAQTASTETWAQIINNSAGDYIQIRRNGASGALTTSTTRAIFTFATGDNYKFDGTSSFSLTGGLGSATSDIGRWVVVSGGTTYISQSSFDPNNSNNTTVYTFDNPDTTNWAAWTPNSDLSNVPGSFTIAGTTLTAITEAGFFFDKLGSTGQNPTFRVFTADLAAVPEPAAYAGVLGLLALVFVLRRRLRA